MKKNLRKIISLVLVLAMALAVSVPAFAAEKTPSAASKSGIREISTEVTDISREEFLKTLADEKGITLVEADRIDRLQTLKDNENEIAKHNNNKSLLQSSSLPASVTPLSTVYKQINQTYDTGTAGSFWSNIIVIIQVKLQRYESSSYGTYQKFMEVLSKGSSPKGSGVSTWSPAAISADIYNDTGYENQIAFMLAGNLEIAITNSIELGYANAVGFSLNTTVGGTFYVRKFVSIDDTFSSNYDLT